MRSNENVIKRSTDLVSWPKRSHIWKQNPRNISSIQQNYMLKQKSISSSQKKKRIILSSKKPRTEVSHQPLHVLTFSVASFHFNFPYQNITHLIDAIKMPTITIKSRSSNQRKKNKRKQNACK